MAKKTEEEIDKEVAEQLRNIQDILMYQADSNIPDFIRPEESFNNYRDTKTKAEELRDNIGLAKSLQGLKNWEGNDPSWLSQVELFKQLADFNKDNVEVQLPDDLLDSDVSRYQDIPSLNDLRIWEITNKYQHRPYGLKSGIASLDTDANFRGQPASVPEVVDAEPIKKEPKEEPVVVEEPKANDAKTQANYSALARQNKALWEYAVYRAANGDHSLFDKLVGDAEARREKEKERLANEASRQELNATTKTAEQEAAFKSAKSKADRALQELNDINDAAKARWKNGTATTEDALNLRRAYRAYQYALDDAQLAASKLGEDFDSSGIFANTTGDLGIDLNAMKGLDFNKLYIGERTLPMTMFDVQKMIDSKGFADALKSENPVTAKAYAINLMEKWDEFEKNHPANMSLGDYQKLKYNIDEAIRKLDDVKAPDALTAEGRKQGKEKTAEQQAFYRLKQKLNTITGKPAEVSKKARELVNAHNKKYKTNYSYPNSFKAGK